MITVGQVNQMLLAQGYKAPTFIMQAAVNKVNGVEACLIGAGLSDDDRLLAQVYAACLIAAGHSQRTVSSQHAPNGASQAWKVGERGMRDMRDALFAIDTAGCLRPLVPPLGKSVMIVTGNNDA